MPKALTIIGMTVAGLLLLLFGADLALGFPFQRANVTMNVLFLLCACVLGYLSWASFREQK
jgi:threonine/homoserine/homoserine lactone efflux protein